MTASASTLILASASPRRAKLLREAGYVFEQVDPPVADDGVRIGHVDAREAAEALAYFKAAGAAEHRRAGIVMGCDTIVVADGRQLGKPANVDDARAMLGIIIGRPHEVVSGVALIDAADGHRQAFCDVATVHIAPLADDVIAAYLHSGRWAGKAGAYNFDELRQAWRFEIRGDATTVIGLPMQRLQQALSHFAPAVELCREQRCRT